ncbi:hypothetical protein SLS62_006750 [Diatrype stigma]|uniref:SnoaL-like domain-containing protein n=1 Tax=Diatrype stigma TaxID=117547 RepID=A0AAN9UM92_9PEZI
MTSPRDPQTKVYSHLRGSQAEFLDRFAVSELCKGWPVYRDASEWKNFASLFCEDAYVWTTWSREQPYDVFIEKSKLGKAAGDFIMHRECGTLVELNPDTERAVGKMKATITQRFTLSPSLGGGEGASPNDGDGISSFEPVVFDVDCDCRFHFFCLKDGEAGDWKVKYVKLIYEKDKVVPVDGMRAPAFRKEVLDQYPEGYKYLGAAQRMLGHDIDGCLPTPNNHDLWLDLYKKMEQWLDGRPDIGLSSSGSGSGGDGDSAIVKTKKNGVVGNGHNHANGHHENGHDHHGESAVNGTNRSKLEGH